MKTLSQINTGRWCQETYETANRDAGRRSRQLREFGYSVVVSALGPQITEVGLVRLTMVSIKPCMQADTFGLPAVKESS